MIGEKMRTARGRVEVLDCTLRDGSYANNFQFTIRDTRVLCKELEQSGIRKIELGHGLGLGASCPKYGVAFESDREYIQAGKRATTEAQIGAFFVVGIGAISDIEEAADCGLDFLRIGCDVTRIAEVRAPVVAARHAGLEVHLNLMKTYALPAEVIVRDLTDLVDEGLEAVYVVDSAGCMIPGEVTGYVEQLVANGWEAGFHGHNNLELANANCLAAAQAGARYVDGTLCGMGRSAGNAQTEVLGWLLAQAGFEVAAVDRHRLFEVADRYLRPLMLYPQGKSALEIIIGMTKFHSDNLARFKKALGRYDVDLYRLIEQVSQVNCVAPSQDLIFEVAKDLSRTDQ